MKLYIPTCSLNFNNILSTESISPTGFYASRGFGIKRFYPVCANDKEQAILLYSKCPLFKVEDTILENSPLVIEIDTDDYKPGLFNLVGEYEGVGVYSCCQTIYLNPFHSIFYFNSNNDIWASQSKAEPSLENKFYKFYNPNCRSADSISIEEKFLWNPMFANAELKNIVIETASDVTIDKIKGFLYCFLIGMNNSVSGEIAKLKSLSRELRNNLSAVVASPDHRPTMVQEHTIYAAIEEFNRIYALIDENSIYNADLDKNMKATANECVSHLENLYKKYYQNTSDINKYCESRLNEIYNLIRGFLPYKKAYKIGEEFRFFNSADPDSFERFVKLMNTHIGKQQEKFVACSEKHQIDKMVQINNDLSLHIIDDKYKYDFYEVFINSQIRDEYKQTMEEKGVQEATAQAYTGGTLLKTMMGDKWENSPASNYMTELLNHFQNSSQFNLFATDNAVLQSFAAFCQKGDDIDRLSEYLVQCGFSEYGLAYGIYGATRGFATLPKTFTSSLIDGDKEYYKEFSKAVWKMLFGVNLQNAELPQPDQKNSWENQLVVVFEEKTDPVPPVPQGSPLSNEKPVEQERNVGLSNLVWEIFDSPGFEFTGEKDDLKEGLIIALDKNGNNGDPTKFLSILSGQSGWGKPKKAWKSMKKLLESREETHIDECATIPIDTKTNPTKRSEPFYNPTKPINAQTNIGASLPFDFGEEIDLPAPGNQSSAETKEVIKNPIASEAKIPFTALNRTNIISRVLQILNLQIDAKDIKQLNTTLISELEYTLDSKYSYGKTKEDFLQDFIKNIDFRNVPQKSQNNKDMRWKIRLYKMIDPAEIEKIIREICILN